MKNRTSGYVIGAVAVILLVAAGTFLPGEIALGRDRVILGQVRSEPLDAAELSDYVNISMVDKVGLLAQSAGTTSVQLKIGAEYDQDTIRAKFLEELDKLYQQRFYPLPVERGLTVAGSGVTLYIQNDAPAINMIVWEIEIRTDKGSGVFYMDDQTGKILSFIFSGAGGEDLIYTEDTAKSWASYLGTEVRNIKKGPAPDETPGSALETLYFFELYSGPMGVSGQIAGFIQPGENIINRWSLNYTQVNYDRIRPQ